MIDWDDLVPRGNFLPLSGSQDRETATEEDLEMRTLIRIVIVVLVACLPAAAGTDIRDSLHLENLSGLRVNLNPWGPHLGFETELAGDDPRVEALLTVIRGAEPGGGHKCANAGAIRFRMKDGGVIGVGLLPSHTAGLYELRLYDGDEYIVAYRVDRVALMSALEDLGLPMDDPAFRE
jgi:hypothetical protein